MCAYIERSQTREMNEWDGDGNAICIICTRLPSHTKDEARAAASKEEVA